MAMTKHSISLQQNSTKVESADEQLKRSCKKKTVKRLS